MFSNLDAVAESLQNLTIQSLTGQRMKKGHIVGVCLGCEARFITDALLADHLRKNREHMYGQVCDL